MEPQVHKKKIIALLLGALLLFSAGLSGCGKPTLPPGEPLPEDMPPVVTDLDQFQTVALRRLESWLSGAMGWTREMEDLKITVTGRSKDETRAVVQVEVTYRSAARERERDEDYPVVAGMLEALGLSDFPTRDREIRDALEIKKLAGDDKTVAAVRNELELALDTAKDEVRSKQDTRLQMRATATVLGDRIQASTTALQYYNAAWGDYYDAAFLLPKTDAALRMEGTARMGELLRKIASPEEKPPEVEQRGSLWQYNRNLDHFKADILDGLHIVLDGKLLETDGRMFRFENGRIFLSPSRLAAALGYTFAYDDSSFGGGNYLYKVQNPGVHGDLQKGVRPDTGSNVLHIGYKDDEYIYTRNADKGVYARYYSEYTEVAIDQPMRRMDGIAYLSLETIRQAFHLRPRVESGTKTLYLDTQDALQKHYLSVVKEWGYDSLDTGGVEILYGYLPVRTGEKLGVVDVDGNILLAVVYDGLWFHGATRTFLLQKNGLFGLADAWGKILLPCQNQQLYFFDGRTDLLKICKDGLCGLVGANGAMVVPLEYTAVGMNSYSIRNPLSLDLDEGVILGDCVTVYTASGTPEQTKVSGKWGIVRLDGSVVLPVEYDAMGITVTDSYGTPVHLFEIDSLAAVVVGRGGKYGAVDKEGRFAVPLIYDAIGYDWSENYWYGDIQGQPRQRLSYGGRSPGDSPTESGGAWG